MATPTNQRLTIMTTKYVSTHAQAAKLIRTELKKHGIKASVRSSSFAGGNSLTVSVTDLAPWTLAAIKTFCRQFQYGHFDGMTDCYEYSNDRKDIPQVKYVSVDHQFSDEIKQQAWTFLRNTYKRQFAELSEIFSEVKDSRFNDVGYTRVDYVVRCALANEWGRHHFWQKPKVRAAA